MNMPDINSLLESLSAEDLSALGDTAQQLFGTQQTEEPAPDIFGGIDPNMLAKIMQLMPMLTNAGDNDRTRLICALKPLLSKTRRKKADEAMQLIRLLEILPILRGEGFGL
ncbi:MAG: hypothetical protein IIW48_00735 [Clostridia bacterium]|nr:hypothetical protein [Clostridia bacterium]